ncbi:MAG: DUF3592 domain-containing protein [Chloroflexaceae bacterium]
MRRIVTPFVLGLSFMVVGVYWGVQTKERKAVMVSATGKVVKMVSDSEDLSYAVVQFRTSQEETISFQSQMRSNPPAYRVGDKVAVLYNPENPQDAVIDSFWELWFGPALVCGIGGFLILIAGCELIALVIPLFR